LLLQAPVASQVPEHRPFGSSLFTAATQVWVVAEHVWHVPEQSLSWQQPPAGRQDVAPPTVQAWVLAGQP
jgi:DNA-directed RNA polymerase